MNTFSDPVLRSHPSNIPEAQVQIYDNKENILFFKKFVDLHVKLSDYKMSLMEEASRLGSPFTRPLMLHFPDDAVARKENSEFMLGENILVAPVFEEGAKTRDVYLPGPAVWTHLWSNEKYTVESKGVDLMDFDTPIGQPAVFIRDTEQVKMTEILADYIGSYGEVQITQ